MAADATPRRRRRRRDHRPGRRPRPPRPRPTRRWSRCSRPPRRRAGSCRAAPSPGCPTWTPARTCSWPAPRPPSSWPAPSAWATSWWRPNRVPPYVWSRGRLHRLPPGLVLGAPAELGPLARSGLLSWRGKARAAWSRWSPGATRTTTSAPPFVRASATRCSTASSGRSSAASTPATPTTSASAPSPRSSPMRSTATAACCSGLRSLPRPPEGAAVFLTPRSGVSALRSATGPGHRGCGRERVPRRHGRGARTAPGRRLGGDGGGSARSARRRLRWS